MSILNIKQREDESLRLYVTHFNKETLLIDEADNKFLVTAFTNGLKRGEFLFSIYNNVPKMMAEEMGQGRGKDKMTFVQTEEGSQPERMTEGTTGD